MYSLDKHKYIRTGQTYLLKQTHVYTLDKQSYTDRTDILTPCHTRIQLGQTKVYRLDKQRYTDWTNKGIQTGQTKVYRLDKQRYTAWTNKGIQIGQTY